MTIELELNKEYTYPQICKLIGWKITDGNSKKAQIKEIESAYEFYHPENKKTHKQKKSYIFTQKNRDLIEPSKSNCGGAHNIKNIQPMIDYLQAKINPDDNDWYSFTDWYCEKLDLMNKSFCNAVYFETETIIELCKKEGISDENLYKEYVSTAKSELKNIFLKSLNYLQKKNQISYQDSYMFFYQLGKRSKGFVISDCINDLIIQNETAVCNDMNEEYHINAKMKGRQLLRILYSNEKYTNEFKKSSVAMLMSDKEAIGLLNKELSVQQETYIPDCGSICAKRPLISYYRGISISDIREITDKDTTVLALEITNSIRQRSRKALYKHYHMYIKPSDLLKIEKKLFQYFDENFADEKYFNSLTDNDLEINELFDTNQKDFTNTNYDEYGETDTIDYSIEEILDMPFME